MDIRHIHPQPDEPARQAERLAELVTALARKLAARREAEDR